MKTPTFEDRCEAWLDQPGRFDRIVRRLDLTAKIAVVTLGLLFLGLALFHAL